MSVEDRLYVEIDTTQAALGWLLDQWLSDTDREWQRHVLDGLRLEDPELFALLDAANVEATGEGLATWIEGGEG